MYGNDHSNKSTKETVGKKSGKKRTPSHDTSVPLESILIPGVEDIPEFDCISGHSGSSSGPGLAKPAIDLPR